jgi:hypothetical protein
MEEICDPAAVTIEWRCQQDLPYIDPSAGTRPNVGVIRPQNQVSDRKKEDSRPLANTKQAGGNIYWTVSFAVVLVALP